MKKGSNNKNLDIIFHLCKRSSKIFVDTEVMGICLHHVKTIVCNQYFFTNIVFVSLHVVKKYDTRKDLLSNRFPTHDKQEGAKFNSIMCHSVCKLQPL